MDNKDVEMEDTQKPDSGNDIKGNDGEVLDSKIELKEDDPPSAVTGAENANQSVNGDDDLNKPGNEAKDQITAMSEMEAQTNHESETNEPMLVKGVGPTGEQIDTESKKEEGIHIEANAELQIASQSISDKLSDVKNEVVVESDANDGLKVENPLENDVESGTPVKNGEGDSSGDVTVENPKDTGETEECVKNVAKIEMAEIVAKREMADENVDSGGGSSENNKLQTGLSSNEAPQVQSVTSVETPQSGDKEMEDAANANEDKVVNDEPKQQGKEVLVAGHVTDGNTKSVETVTRLEGNDSSPPNQHEVAIPNSIVRYLPTNMGNHSGDADRTVYTQATLPLVMNKSQKKKKILNKKEKKCF